MARLGWTSDSFAALFTLAVIFATTQAFYDGENREIFCKGEPVKKSNFHGHFKDCMHEFRDAKATLPEGERKTGHTCLAICALTKDGLFDQTGAYQEAKMMASVEESLPAHLADVLKQEITKCVTDHAVATLVHTNDDPTCKKYRKFLRCTAGGWMKTCIEGFDPEVWTADMDD